MSTTPPPSDPYSPYEPGDGAPRQQPGVPPQGYDAPSDGSPQYGSPSYDAHQYGSPQYGTQQYGTPWGAQQPVGTDGVSIAALVTGILGLGIVPLILGIVGLNRTRRTGQNGKGLAIAGIVLGGITMLAGIAVIIGVAVLASNEDVQQGFRDAWQQGTEDRAADARRTVGDCVPLDADLSTMTRIVTVDCAGEHGGEVVGVKEMTDAAYPGLSQTEDLAGEFCMDAFFDYVGIDYDQSQIDLTFYYPSDVSWEQGDRQIACLAVSQDGSALTGSVRGSAR